MPAGIRTLYMAGMASALGACRTELENTGDGMSANAPGVVFYAGTGEGCCGTDPHPVHGTQAPDGGFVLVGKSADAGGSIDGFVVKIGPGIPEGTLFLESGGEAQVAWSRTFGSDGSMEAANNVVATADGVFVAGAEQGGDGTLHRALRKYDGETGSLEWSALFPSQASGTDSAIESLSMTPGGDLLAAGFTGGEQGEVEGFKSYGNPVSGQACAMLFTSEQLSAGSAPGTPAWESQLEGLGSVRAIRSMPDGGHVLAASVDEEIYAAVRTGADGEELWRTRLEGHGEATDLAVATSGGEATGIAVTGHFYGSQGIDGSVTMLDLDGERLWHRTYGNPAGGVHEFAGLDEGSPALIFDECWGVQPTDRGGVVIACGTGIEGCGEHVLNGRLRRECRRDPRTKWRALLIEVDASGEELWHRTDSYYFEGETEAAESASEYVVPARDGGFASVVDQDFGIGLMLLEPFDP